MCNLLWGVQWEGEGRTLALRQEELTSLCDDVDLDRDRALVERCQAGDSAAFGNLYARYYERLLRFCMRRLNDRHEAEDAAQEAFARAWKALPRFAGERRFYPWLTVIAGNICTDMLRRRSRSTPTDDMELTAQQPVGAVVDDTSEELVLAAVDGELVNRALDRLSVRHRHVLAMREGSGWTYQQIADHEGVEIGTIETLLWRARQALKREFAVVSESNGALAGFLIATVALFRRTLFRVAHRGASVQQQAGGTSGEFGLRNAFAGIAVAGAAVAAAFIAPHALSSNGAKPTLIAPASSALAAPPLALASVNNPGGSGGGASSSTNGSSLSGGTGTGTGSSASDGAAGSVVGTAKNATKGATSVVGGLTGGLTGGSNGGAGGVTGLTKGLTQATTDLGTAVGGTVGGVTGGVNKTVGGVTKSVGGVTGTVGKTVGGVTGTVGKTVGGVTGNSGLGGSVGGTVGGVTGNTGLGSTLGGVTGAVGGSLSGVTGAVGGLLGGSTSGSSGSGTTSTPTTTTTTTTSGLLGGLGNTLGGL
jgi:RNA polymerase sigma factor (sigma-70 family)